MSHYTWIPGLDTQITFCTWNMAGRVPFLNFPLEQSTVIMQHLEGVTQTTTGPMFVIIFTHNCTVLFDTQKTCYCQFIRLKNVLISCNKSIHIVTCVGYFLTITKDWEKTPISPFLITRMFLYPSSLSPKFLWEHANCGDTCFGLSLFVFPPLYVPTAGLLELLRWALCVDS